MKKINKVLQLPYFREGESNWNVFSAFTMNRIIKAINMLLKIRGANGIKVTKSDSGYVISPGTQDVEEEVISTGGGGGQTINNNYTTTVNCMCRYS